MLRVPRFGPANADVFKTTQMYYGAIVAHRLHLLGKGPRSSKKYARALTEECAAAILDVANSYTCTRLNWRI